jgi:hypothetical protein
VPARATYLYSYENTAGKRSKGLMMDKQEWEPLAAAFM